MASLVPKYVFGLQGSVRDNIHFIDETSVVYPAGHNTVLYHIEQRTQKFIPGTADTDGISAIALSPNRKVVAVAERASSPIGSPSSAAVAFAGGAVSSGGELGGGPGTASRASMLSDMSKVSGMGVASETRVPSITIYDINTLKRRKVLSGPDVGSNEYVSLCFSPDGRAIAAQAGAPDWNLVLWIWEKSKLSCSARTTNQLGGTVFQVQFNPSDSSMISVVGSGFVKMFKATDFSLKQVPNSLIKRDPQTYPCHAWLVDGGERGEKERCIVATDTGEMLLVEGGETRAVIGSVAGEEAGIVEAIVRYSRGFICGRESGMIEMYEKVDTDREKEGPYKRVRSFSIENNSVKVCSLAISPSEETIVCTLENNQLFVLSLATSDITKADGTTMELLAQAFHSDAITGLDVCIRKPLVVTCSTDKSVRIWNYLDKTCELLRFFNEEAHSVAMHPSGFHLVVGFSDKLRLINILMEDLRVYKEFGIKACKECVFSHGGQYFAAAHSNTIQIFNTYTCENVGNLRGHNGKVRSVFWTVDDTGLVTAGMDGAVYEWTLKECKRETENVIKGCGYSCVHGSYDSNSVFAVGSDKKLKEIDDSQVVKQYNATVVLTQIALPSYGRLLFAGTEVGTVRAYRYPLTGEFQEVQSCCSAVSRIRLSYDDNLLFVAGEDGCLFMFDVRDKEKGIVSSIAKREKEAITYAEEVLVTKSDLEEKKVRTTELEQQVNELTMQNEYQLRLKDLNLNERIKDITDKFTHELDQAKSRYETLLQTKTEQEMEYEEKIKQEREKYAQQMASMEGSYQQKIMAEVERYQALMQEKEQLNQKWDEQNALLVETHEQVIQELTEEYESKLGEEHTALEKVEQDKEDAVREHEETTRQLEEDADQEIEELKERYEAKLAQEREVGLRLKGENGIMKKKFNALQKDIEDQKEEIKQLFEQKKELYQTIASLEKDISGLKKEIKERDETIGDKEKRIHDLKKKNQELEKFKFVLDYKIKELKKQIEPREQEIAEMKEQIKDMDKELERYHKANANLELTITELKLKLDGQQREVARIKRAHADAASQIVTFEHDLYETAQLIQDPRALKEAVKTMYHKYVSRAPKHKVIDDDILQEYNRQREYLERTVDGLKRKLDKDMDVHRTLNTRIIQENVSLIKEINQLRREMKQLKQSAQRAKDLQEFGGPVTSPKGRSRVSAPSRHREPLSPSEAIIGMASQLQSKADNAAPLSPSSMTSSSRIHLEEAMDTQLAAMQAAISEAELAIKESDGQKLEIQTLKAELAKKEQLIAEMRGAKDDRINETVLRRPKSREMLPLMDGFPSVSGRPQGSPPTILSPTAEADVPPDDQNATVATQDAGSVERPEGSPSMILSPTADADVPPDDQNATLTPDTGNVQESQAAALPETQLASGAVEPGKEVTSAGRTIAAIADTTGIEMEKQASVE
ncbi:hypothetical protein CBR_g23749 [Chara braunii]|uniref:EML-like second beta-propeller domain-containing protein n=1 Tax=Chara braunii TaxID=69332 RepID=A0A388JVI4_CHABU|nr:hypothetical protein CBR_g23749 [Chara braunii]|eukprot:GBG61790.1 hypothetical protein CBR_g23749 [Chara braunii]